MNYRNAKHLDGARIDCEIEHPDYGWIPFTCDPTDTGATIDVVALYDAMAADPATAAYVYAPPEPPTLEQQRAARATAYALEADPLFFMAQRGKATQQEWLDKIAEIEARFPYPEV
jgi:hypothetical protein